MNQQKIIVAIIAALLLTGVLVGAVILSGGAPEAPKRINDGECTPAEQELGDCEDCTPEPPPFPE